MKNIKKRSERGVEKQNGESDCQYKKNPYNHIHNTLTEQQRAQPIRLSFARALIMNDPLRAKLLSLTLEGL